MQITQQDNYIISRNRKGFYTVYLFDRNKYVNYFTSDRQDASKDIFKQISLLRILTMF